MAQINANTRSTILLCLGALGVAIALGIYTYSRFHVYEVHPDCSFIAVGTRHCRVPTSVVYLTNLKSAVSLDFSADIAIGLSIRGDRLWGTKPTSRSLTS